MSAADRPPAAAGKAPGGLRRVLLMAALLGLLGGCGGGGGSGTPPPPASAALTYAFNPCAYRVGEAIVPNTATLSGGSASSWSVLPMLPPGLELDPVTGALTGTPTGETPQAAYTVTATTADGSVQTQVELMVGPSLPAPFASLAPGFQAEVILEPGVPSPAKIAKFALAPGEDERIFYIEVDTGAVRVFDPGQGLLAVPFVQLNVLQGGHNGILGLALSPDFASDGFVYVLACVPGDPMAQTNDRIQILRYTDVSNVGSNETVVVDDLPVSPPMGVNNGGELLFGLDGTLFVSIGDVQDPAHAQADAATSLAGKVLRYDVSTTPATVPSDNPFPGSPEWCRGLRNTFGLAVQPTTGGLFGLDNGPAADDELNYLAAGMNFEWGGTPAPPVGFKIRNWQTVIVPTALCWHTGIGWGTAYAGDLFLTAYDDHKIHRLEMSGASFVDLDQESEFASFQVSGIANHPLDICLAADGSLYVSTFSGIYRIYKP